MNSVPLNTLKVAVIGLGYVGLPLAIRLSEHFLVIGFDVDSARLDELLEGHDRTGESSPAELENASYSLTSDPAEIGGCDVYIVTVPTPVDDQNTPDLSAVLAASDCVGRALKPGSIVVYESTVYPGVTEDICGPALEAASGMVSGTDFYLGYSPERINPGDREHTLDKIIKVIAGQTPEVTDLLGGLYSTVTAGGVFKAKNIKTAEAAKVIENAQRDINIAFINEVAMIFNNMGIQTHDVLEAAETKWNFLNFQPGLVGGHCIGVDPFYLAHAAREQGHHPEVILAGRRINDGIAAFAATQIDIEIKKAANGGNSTRVLILGLTFKENVPDLRNSKSVDLITELKSKGHSVDVHDAIANPAEAKSIYGLELLASLDGAESYDCIVGTVPHSDYRAFSEDSLTKLLKQGGLLADLKGMWRDIDLGENYRRWEL